MTRFHLRIGEPDYQELLKQSIHTGLKSNAVNANDIKRVTVDTTVQ